MKKFLAILVTLMLLLPVFGVAEEAEPAAALPTNLNYDYDELVVGTTMPMYGAFSFSNWGNAGSDVDVRKLIHGYNLIEWDNTEGGFVLDPSVVAGSLVEGEENGDHVYNIMLAEDLYYSDGTKITAWDYAFSWLLRMSPVIGELGGTPSEPLYISGCKEYLAGELSTLVGIRVPRDNQISIRISAAYLPFFYEVGLLDCYPVPVSAIAPGCEVADDGEGIYLTAPLDAAQLQETLLNAETGYLSHPSVTSGAYKLVSFDGTEATFELNEYYKGNSDGVKPVVPRIVFRTANQETMVEDLANAKFGLLNKVMRAESIQQGTTLSAETGRYRFNNYPRAGLSFIAFNTEQAGVADAAVRQAIARCLDKEGLTTDYAGPYGLKADGFYGIGQWMYQMVNGTLNPPVAEDATEADIEKAEQAWAELNMEAIEAYEFDPAAAAAALEADGWKLNADGVREKEIDGQTVTLALKMVYPSTTPIGEILEARFAAPLKEAGIQLTIEAHDAVLPMYYGQIERDYDMAFLATNFDVLFDPSSMFDPEGANNTTGIKDPKLYELAVDMKQTEPGDLLSYCQKWFLFLQQFAADEPMIPVYSNVYYDFYPDVLQNYLITENITWSEAVIPSYLSDPPEEAEDAEEELIP